MRLEQRKSSCSVVLVGLGGDLTSWGDLNRETESESEGPAARRRRADRTGARRDGTGACDAKCDGDRTGKAVGVTDGTE